MARGSGSVKADQWRSQLNILFVALFVAWEQDGEIPDTDAPLFAPTTKNAAAHDKLLRERLLANLLEKSPNASDEQIVQVKSAMMNQSYRCHYETTVEFSPAVRILSSHEISPDEVRRGCAALSQNCKFWARMSCHLTSYFHFAQHMEPQYLQLGPCYGWWVYGYERNNGWLGRTAHNGHSGGELEATMMRRWWKVKFIQDLVHILFISIFHP